MMKTKEQIKLDSVVWFDLVEALQAFVVLTGHVQEAASVSSHWTRRTITKLQEKLDEFINEAPELLGKVAEDSDVEFFKASGDNITEEEIEMFDANGYADIEGNIVIVYGSSYCWGTTREDRNVTVGEAFLCGGCDRVVIEVAEDINDESSRGVELS